MCVFVETNIYSVCRSQFDRHAKLHCTEPFRIRVTKSNLSQTEYDFRFGMLTIVTLRTGKLLVLRMECG